ncbi:MAG: Gfo/Idh/MocA family oxidoreductase [Bradymonadia bacterium]|jgi:UDP-2-acetamido-3-amino-2,3-dideoxy-glucuronate N-acetyltransferase
MGDAPRAVVVIGLGAHGNAAAARAQAMGLLRGVADVDPAPVEAVADVLGPGVLRTLDPLEALRLQGVDAVVLTSPAGTHEGLAESALRAGRSVWLPAPPPIPSARIEALAALARSKGLRYVDTPWLLHEPAVALFLAALAAWREGAPTVVEAEVRLAAASPETPDPFFPLPAAETLTALTLMGAVGPPESIDASAVRTTGTLDHVVARWRGADGVRRHLTVSRLPGPSLLTFRAHGSAGSLSLTLPLGLPYGVTAEASIGCAGDGVPVPEPHAAGHGFERALEAFFEGADVEAGRAQREASARAAFAHLRARVDTGTPRPGGPVLHPTVALDGDTSAIEVGEGTRVWHFSKLIGPCKIGARCSLGQNVVVERHVVIGDNVKIQNNVSLYEGVELEDDVFCGPSMVFTNIGTPRSAYPRKGQYARTLVRRGASIGANATVVCGNTLGRCCFVGAAAVVTRDVPDYALVYGNPARVQGFACWCGLKLPLGHDRDGEEQATCSGCGRTYGRKGHSVRALDERPDA